MIFFISVDLRSKLLIDEALMSFCEPLTLEWLLLLQLGWLPLIPWHPLLMV